MIAIAAPTYDLVGYLALPIQVREPYQARRRGSVTATLDGESSVFDGGYSISDTTYTATWRGATRAQLVTLTYLIAYYAELVVSVETGCFSARCELATRGNEATLSARILRRLDT